VFPPPRQTLFRPKTGEHLKQPLAIIADAELDRDAVIAVKMVGQGEFGEVYLVGGADLGF
jgi:hypothetical protein